MVPASSPRRHPTVLIALSLLAILWLAAYLRWRAPDLIPYTYDEADQIARMTSLTTRSGPARFLGGGTHVGLDRSALHATHLRLPLTLGDGRVEFAVWWMGALGVLAVALGYRLGAAAGGPWCGVWTALLLAANPWVIQGDRRLWAHVYMALSVAIPLLAWEAMVRRRDRALVALPLAAALQLLAHLLALLQATSWPVALLLAPRAWRRRAFGLGILLALLLVSPYVWAVLAHTQWNLGQIPGLSWQPLALHWEALASPHTWPPLMRLVTGLNVTPRALLGQEQPWVGVLLLALVGLGVLRLARETRHPARGLGARLFLLWPIPPLIILALRPLPVYEQYWTVLAPWPALYAALGLDQVRRLLPTTRLAAPALTLVTASVVAVWIGVANGNLAALAAGERGHTLREWRRVMESAVAQARAEDLTTIRFIADGRDPAVDGDAAAVTTLLPPMSRTLPGPPLYARFVEAARPPGLLLARHEPSLHVVMVDAPLQEAALTHLGELRWRGEVGGAVDPARLYRAPAYDPAPLGITPLEPAPMFDAGLQLVGTRLPAHRAELPAVYTLVWEVFEHTTDASTRAFTAYNHILAADGTMVAQVDGLSLLSRDWWPGDVLVQAYPMTLAAGDYVWRVGLYSQTDGGRAYIHDPAGWVDHVDIPFHVMP